MLVGNETSYGLKLYAAADSHVNVWRERVARLRQCDADSSAAMTQAGVPPSPRVGEGGTIGIHVEVDAGAEGHFSRLPTLRGVRSRGDFRKSF